MENSGLISNQNVDINLSRIYFLSLIRDLIKAQRRATHVFNSQPIFLYVALTCKIYEQK